MIVGDIILLNKKYFVDNILLTQYFEGLKPGVPYQINEVTTLDSATGVTILQNIETGETFDISSVSELEEYWCLVDAFDSYRLVPSA